MKKSMFFKITVLILILFNMFIIFHYSSEKAETSTQTSRGVTEKILEITVEDFRGKPIQEQKALIKKANNNIRTLAHFSEYALLGFLTASLLSLYKMSKIKNAILAFAGCVIYAISDEIHQLYVPGRSFQLKDILTDSLGVFLGISVFLLLFEIVKRFSKKKTAVS